MIELKVKEYQNSDKEKWDAFVMKHSINGTFLQTKNFLDYQKVIENFYFLLLLFI